MFVFKITLKSEKKKKKPKNYCTEAQFYEKQVNESPKFTSFEVIKIGI